MNNVGLDQPSREEADGKETTPIKSVRFENQRFESDLGHKNAACITAVVNLKVSRGAAEAIRREHQPRLTSLSKSGCKHV